ncbi:ABC transporter substrate-binding protein [Paenibacillus agaridevorans]|uniref:ABC transporter substrate-binding protein n=1 Tax=Paenibacillus agaridevorans TaxID=171404 RepID=UPI001BE44868|nr:ABC transporter substrate-binding protein [Paenibacillus agaridevorans]
MYPKKNIMLLVVLCLALVLSACSGGNGNGKNGGSDPAPGNKGTAQNGEEKKPAEELSKVELVWYYPQPAIPSDLKSVESKVNELIEPKINATVKLMPLAFGDYTQKMNTVIASGEKADIVWTSNWNFNYVQNQSKGAFIPLDELIDRYAPDVKASMPDFVWEATRIDGQIYGVPNYQTVTNREGFVLQKEFYDLYKPEAEMKQLADLAPLLEQVKRKHPDLIPFAVGRQGMFSYMNRTYGLESVLANIAVIHLDNPDKIVNMYETEEYRQYLDTMRDFYEKGYINEDAATLKSIGDYQKAGQAVGGFHNVLKPGGEAEAKASQGGKDMQYAFTTDAYVGTNTIITTLQAIPVHSGNPERAMMLINLVNTDPELFNLLAFGIEGTHYNKKSDGSVELVPDSAYTASDWVFGNVFNGYTLAGKDPNVAKETKELNESATPSPIIGFKFVTESVSAEIANVTTVIDEYGPGLNTGTVAADRILEEFQGKLKQAGIDRVIEEAQRQLDEWKASGQ